MTQRGPVLVFGGTFDPVHRGHVAIARQAADQLGAAQVWFVPSAIPALHAPPAAAPDARLAMLRAALAGDRRMRPLDVELRRGGVSFTVDTMRALHGEHPRTDLRLLLGADAARGIGAWDRADELLGRERFVIVNRSGEFPLDTTQLRTLGFDAERTQILRVDSPEVSATEVRRRAALGERLAGLVAPDVEALIHRHRLYGAGERGA